MALPSSGTLDYSSIRAEFGAPTANVSLSLFNRSGAYVYNVPANSNIPTSTTAQISVSNFYGARSKTKYAAGPGGYYSTGGKVPTYYRGTGGPSLPGFTDSGFYVDGTQTTISSIYYESGGVPNVGYTNIQVTHANWSTTVKVYRNDNGSNTNNIVVSGGTFGGNPGGWSSNWWREAGGPDYSGLHTSQLNIYKGF